jgi:hypothetical protein
MKAVRFRATLKALSINMLRAAAVLAALINSPKYPFAAFSIIKGASCKTLLNIVAIIDGSANN